MLISVTNLKSGKEGGYAVMNQPFQIVKIPVAEKEIEFGFDLAGKGDDNPDIALAGTKWKVKSQNMSGESVNIISPPEDALYPDISIQIPDTIKGSIIGNTFYNYIWINFEIKDNQQILFENYGGSRIAEDDWGRAFSDNLRNTVKFVFSNNELTFLDLQDKPTVVFTHK
jgi:hypothetical protein